MPGRAGEIAVASYTPDLAERWDLFVRERARNGTIFHERRFLAYHGERFADCSLAALDGRGELLAVCPAAWREEDGRRGAASHPGSSYGGVVFRDDLKTPELKAVLDAFIRRHHEMGAAFLRLTLQEEFHTGRSCGELPFLLWHRGFTLLSKEASSVVDLDEALRLANFRKTTRQYVASRKDARLGVTHHLAESEAEVAAAYAVLAGNLDRRYGKQPAHSLDELLLLRRLYPERVRIFFSRLEGAVAAVVVVFDLDGRVAHDFYIAQKAELAAASPLVGLFLHIFAHYRDAGFRLINFGISSRGRWIKWGILNFKEQFGGRLLTRDHWRLDDLGGQWPDDGEPQ